VVRPESDIPPCVDVGDKSGGSRRGLGVGVDAPEEEVMRPKKRTRKVNSAEALSSRTKLIERKIASTGRIYYQLQSPLVGENSQDPYHRPCTPI
jgi:hypothetical protein